VNGWALRAPLYLKAKSFRNAIITLGEDASSDLNALEVRIVPLEGNVCFSAFTGFDGKA